MVKASLLHWPRYISQRIISASLLIGILIYKLLLNKNAILIIINYKSVYFSLILPEQYMWNIFGAVEKLAFTIPGGCT